MKEPIGRFGSCRPARARRTAVETALTASDWPTTRLAQAFFHLEELVALAFEHLVDRNAGPARNDLRHMVLGHRLFDHRIVLGLLLDLLELLLEPRNGGVSELARLGEVAFALRLLESDARLAEFLLERRCRSKLLLLRLPFARQLTLSAPEGRRAPSRAARAGPWKRGRFPFSAPRARSASA